MKIKNISDINKFSEIVDECEEKVELITSQGDIIIYSPKDTEKLMGFFA